MAKLIDGTTQVFVEDTSGETHLLAVEPGGTSLNEVGITASIYNNSGVFENNGFATAEVVYSQQKSSYVTKLYGSVNGRSKLVYVGKAGRPIAPIGQIVYYTSYATDADTTSINIYDQNDLDGLCGQNLYVTINGTQIDTQLIKEVHFNKLVNRSFGDYFLSGYMMLDTIDLGESSITSLGDYAFALNFELRENTTIALPQTLTHIGNYFMNACSNFCGVLDVGNLYANIASSDSNSLAVFGSSMSAYTTGVTIKGNTRASWLERFPNRMSSPYRKLLDGGN